jgi:hypothetical protein
MALAVVQERQLSAQRADGARAVDHPLGRMNRVTFCGNRHDASAAAATLLTFSIRVLAPATSRWLFMREWRIGDEDRGVRPPCVSEVPFEVPVLRFAEEPTKMTRAAEGHEYLKS